jgi:hypothetical protein
MNIDDEIATLERRILKLKWQRDAVECFWNSRVISHQVNDLLSEFDAEQERLKHIAHLRWVIAQPGPPDGQYPEWWAKYVVMCRNELDLVR